MRKFIFSTLVASTALVGTAIYQSVNAADEGIMAAKFAADGQVFMPQGWRKWVYIGTPLTPNALNEGKASFPEFHNVYIEPTAYDHWQKTGTFAEGTQIAKELVLIRKKDADEMHENGSTDEVSGTGYFQGEFQGLELTIKDNKRYASEPGGWAYFSFGHQPEPYAKTAKAFPTDSCNACHEGAADDDFVFTQFYPVLRAAKP